MIVKGELVPVARTTLHVEQTREIVRRFNRTYHGSSLEPQALLEHSPRAGDGWRRQTGTGNAIFPKTNRTRSDGR